jgi:hypothetical protein
VVLGGEQPTSHSPRPTRHMIDRVRTRTRR